MKKLLYIVMFLSLAPLSAQATVYDVHSPTLWGVASGVGTGRAQGIHADSSFSVSSIGLFGDLVSQSFDIVIYSSVNGHSAGSVLATASQVVGGTGMGWNDIALDFDFLANNFYVVNWRPTTSNSTWGTLEYYLDSALPVTVGPLTLVEGFEGYNLDNPGNSLHPRLRYNTSALTTVPAPEMFGLFALGLIGFGLMRRKNR